MKTLRLQRSTPNRALRASALAVLTGLTLACGDEVTEPGRSALHTTARQGNVVPGAASAPVASVADNSDPGAQTLTLPFVGSATSTSPAFHVVQRGTGHAGVFQNTNSSGVRAALWAQSINSGAAVFGLTTGSGEAGYFQLGNTGSFAPAVHAITNGTGAALRAENIGATGGSGQFVINALSSAATALWAYTRGSGTAVVGTSLGNGSGGVFGNSSATSTGAGLRAYTNGTGAALIAHTTGTGPVVVANHLGSTGAIALFQTNGANQIRFNKSGKGFFNGGTQTGGADVAEAFEVEGRVSDYEPGDVLVISEHRDRRVEKSSDSYSTRVVGVYATKPGLLLTEHDIDTSLDDHIPLGVVGVIPTKVSVENGAIRRGDLLVTARRPGYAMRGTARGRMLGAIIGKALEPFAGPEIGVIRVLVSVK
jgi:trimeric autotransporter adhesin